MQTYDAIVVLGSQPSTETWEFPVQVYECLDRSIQLFDEHKAPYIITSGRWSIAIDALGLTQPFCECDKMADYLVEKGLPYGFVLREAVSKESISNLYCLKTDFSYLTI